METYNYQINVVTCIEQRTIYIAQATIDEVVSIAKIYFDKYSRIPRDFVTVSIPKYTQYGTYSSKVIRKIELKEGLKIEISAFQN